MSADDRRAVEMFARWAELFDAEIRILLPDLPSSAAANGSQRNHLRTVRNDPLATYERDFRVLESFRERVVLPRSTGRSLYARYVEIERRAGPRARDLLLHEITDSFSSGSRDLFGYVRNRARAWLLLCVVGSAHARDPLDPLIADAGYAFWKGILKYAFPQWVPWFMTDYEWACEIAGVAPGEVPANAEDQLVFTAGELNTLFYEYAAHGELLAFTLVAEHLADSDAKRASIGEWRKRNVSRACASLAKRLKEAVNRGPVGTNELLRQGARYYCEMLMGVRYGRLEIGSTAAGDTLLGAELVSRFFPGDHAAPFHSGYRDASLGGLLGGANACGCLLRTIHGIDEDAHRTAAYDAARAGRDRLRHLRQLSHPPISELALRHVEATLHHFEARARAGAPRVA